MYTVYPKIKKLNLLIITQDSHCEVQVFPFGQSSAEGFNFIVLSRHRL